MRRCDLCEGLEKNCYECMIDGLLDVQDKVYLEMGKENRELYYAKASDPVGKVRVFRCQHCEDGAYLDDVWKSVHVLKEFTPIFMRMIADGRSNDANTFVFVEKAKEALRAVGIAGAKLG